MPDRNAEPTSFRRSATFTDTNLERAYRREYAGADRQTIRICVLITMGGGVVFAVSDYWMFGTGVQFQALLAVRAAVLVLSVLLWVRLGRRLAPGSFDRAVFLWGAAMIAAMLYVTSTRPPSYAGHAVVNLGSVLLAYTVVPLPLVRQVVLAVALSAGCVVLAVLNGHGDKLTTAAVCWPFLGANALGFAISRRLHRQSREGFATRALLETALAEVKTLRGLVRVCAWCQKVATDHGWQQFEAYVRDHTHAEFTHGICPVCVATVQIE